MFVKCAEIGTTILLVQGKEWSQASGSKNNFFGHVRV